MKVTLYAISAAALLAATAVQAAEFCPRRRRNPASRAHSELRRKPRHAGRRRVPAGLWSTAGRSGLTELPTECGVAFAWQPRLGRCARTGDVGFRNQHAEFEQRTRYQQRVARARPERKARTAEAEARNSPHGR